MGVYDQRPLEERRDVLCYTSEPLTHALEITGPITVKLYAASSAPDTDFTAKLVDVRPDGYVQNLADGIIRARYRESRANPSLITPGMVYEYTIDLWSTSMVFHPGHRLRVEIASVNFPRFDRNPNTGHVLFSDGRLQSATQAIFHDAVRPSRIVLPVIPRYRSPSPLGRGSIIGGSTWRLCLEGGTPSVAEIAWAGVMPWVLSL
jgi:putative CocE/NonD family hydrolase